MKKLSMAAAAAFASVGIASVAMAGGPAIISDAEMDLIVAVSACPVGDYAVPMTEPDGITARPLGFEIYQP